MYRKIQIVFDCADPAAMMAFWGPATIEEGGGMFTVMRDPEENEFCVH